ncbi:MAG TPA: zinc-dependent metalloprotease [Solirubrobacteraceae bacterium]|nr:zinc-dependent metalloprotease [Solirubrobacteraceae bacterium]
MIDWRLATNVAGAVAGMQTPPPSEPFERVAGPTEESERLVSAYTGLRAASPIPPPEPVNRTVWIESNLASLRTVLDPVAARLGSGLGPFGAPVGAAAGVVLALEVGAISGLLAQRVLGQYEFAILEPEAPARLLFVAPNLAHAAGTLDAEADELLRWVALHEVTHALQFGGVPWLREHLAGMVRELLAALDVDPRRMMRLPDAADLRALVEMAREGDLTTLVVGPERRAHLDRMQAFMAVLEGYAEHVMDAVGADLLPDLPRLREALDRRRRDRSGLLRVFERLLGLELKLRQYQQGKAFCDAVVTAGGISALNRVWEAPERLPTLAEIVDPVGWLARTTPADAA